MKGPPRKRLVQQWPFRPGGAMLTLPFAILLVQNYVFFQKALNAPDSPGGPIAKGVISSGVEQGFAITAWGVPVSILGLVIVITSVVRHVRTMEKGRLS